MSSTLLCIGHPLHGERAVFTPIWKFVFFFFFFLRFILFLCSPHSSHALIHHFHSWFYVWVCALGLFTKNFISYAIPFFPWRSTILFNIHLFNHAFFFSFAIPMASTSGIHYVALVPVSLFLMPFVPSSIFSTTTKKEQSQRKIGKILWHQLFVAVCRASERVTELVRRKWSITLITSPKERASNKRSSSSSNNCSENKERMKKRSFSRSETVYVNIIWSGRDMPLFIHII